MDTIIKISQIVVAIILSIAILLQNKEAGLSGVFGGGDNIYRTKRGVEKTLHTATIVLAILFFFISLASFMIVKS